MTGHTTRSLARIEALDGLRSRRQLVLRAVTPLALFALVLVVYLLTRGTGPDHPEPYVVAVQGDLDGARATLAQVNGERVRLVPTDDAALAAARSADVAVSVPDRLDERRRRGEQTSVVLYERASTAESRTAAAYVRAGLSDLHKQEVGDALAGAGRPDTVVTLDVTDVERTQAGTRALGSEVVAVVILLQASLLVGTTASRLLSRHNRGLLLAQLLLPFERWRLALAKGLAELELGLITAAPIAAVALVFTLVVAWGRDGAAAAIVGTAAAALSLAAFATVMVAAGLTVGTRCRTQEQVSLVSAVLVVLAAVVASQVGLSAVPPPPGLAVVPVVGLEAALRNQLAGTGSVAWTILAMATTLLFAAGLVGLAGRAFDAERLVLRED